MGVTIVTEVHCFSIGAGKSRALTEVAVERDVSAPFGSSLNLYEAAVDLLICANFSLRQMSRSGANGLHLADRLIELPSKVGFMESGKDLGQLSNAVPSGLTSLSIGPVLAERSGRKSTEKVVARLHISEDQQYGFWIKDTGLRHLLLSPTRQVTICSVIAVAKSLVRKHGNSIALPLVEMLNSIAVSFRQGEVVGEMTTKVVAGRAYKAAFESFSEAVQANSKGGSLEPISQ